MALFAIADLHLAFGVEKPMDVFGSRWYGYMERIEAEWRRTVSEEDTVLLPGDLSWAINLEELEDDLRFVESLPGKKIIGKGNHDYWWETITKLNQYLIEKDLKSITFQYNDAVFTQGFAVAGTRGWRCPSEENFTVQDQKVHARELLRFEMSLQQAKSIQLETNAPILAMLHYPPLDPMGKDFGFFDLLQRYGVSVCVYGHIHGEACSRAFEGEVDGIQLKLISADHLTFCPYSVSSV